ncbi:MAG: bifunctional hydroxymethylpyrimidine kinase/phosphomethylpyrimidine kinase [Firmicutes bacterium]|nr:bifunctional hydroxymethylpyrimidine kinase/phosphomethylpyrimidine kinase [Bacillota bacterium]
MVITRTPQVLTIAGSDTSSGAGIQADLKTFQIHKVYGATVITSVTAQNSRKVQQSFDLPVSLIQSQFKAVMEDFKIKAAKTGMLSSPEIVSCISDLILKYKIKNLIIDPVMISKTGYKLLNKEGVETLKSSLLPLALLATPNFQEAEILSGIKIDSLEKMKEAAEKIQWFGCRAVLIKTGDSPFNKGADLFWDGKEFRIFKGKPVPGKNPHGTGCVFSAAITARIARGENLLKAISHAKQFTQKAIQKAHSNWIMELTP